MSTPPDRFDEIRRKWIARHQYSFGFQKKRQEALARQIRDRVGVDTGARGDPADDDIMHSWFMRGHDTVYAKKDLWLYGVAGIAAPLGWPLGKALYHSIIQAIPGQLRSYPVAALAWAAVIVGIPLPLLYSPGDSWTSTVIVPLVIAQFPAALLAAALYGIAEGWLAVDGARDWWPMSPPEDYEHVDFGVHAQDLTLPPSAFEVAVEKPVGERTPIKRDGNGRV
ncbi:MAG: hypothetical protein QG597_561 [Actinomycetota bacterium]|nr:hypothetical protein [Actinomycetota bacterium]